VTSDIPSSVPLFAVDPRVASCRSDQKPAELHIASLVGAGHTRAHLTAAHSGFTVLLLRRGVTRCDEAWPKGRGPPRQVYLGHVPEVLRSP
jgi:hypothetical protein